MQRGKTWFVKDSQRTAIIKYLNKGLSVRKVASRVGVGSTSVFRAKKHLAENNTLPERKGFARQVLSDDIENALADLIKDMRTKGIFVSNDETRKMAYQIAQNGVSQNRVQQFRLQHWIRNGQKMASESWLKGFLRRRGRFLGRNPTRQPIENEQDKDNDDALSTGTVSDIGEVERQENVLQEDKLREKVQSQQDDISQDESHAEKLITQPVTSNLAKVKGMYNNN